jgi:hypothetical protein
MEKTHLALLPMVALAVIASGCVSASPQPVSAQAKADVVNFSGPIADNILEALNIGDYARFSRGFSGTMKASIDQDRFNQLRSNIFVISGKYLSRRSEPEVDELGGYYRATYSASFVDESPVYMLLTFKKGDANHTVEGLFFSSKKLAGAA